LFVAALHAVRDVLVGRAAGRRERRTDSASRSGRANAGPADADSRAAKPASRPQAGSADQGGTGHPPGDGYDPRPHEDKARRRLAYLLFTLLAVIVLGLLALVALGVITVTEVKEFDVIIAALVPLVMVTIAYYFKSGGKGR
jgi:hypothetical protein